jgi:hypothetical protein
MFMHLDEVDSDTGKLVHGAAAFHLIAHRDSIGIGGAAVQNRPRRHDSRPDSLARQRLYAPSPERLETRRPHVANAGNSRRNQDRQSRFRSVADVNVHIPEAGNQKFSRRVYESRVFRNAHLCRLADFRNAIADHHDSHVSLGG